jgi:TPR repeat protein
VQTTTYKSPAEYLFSEGKKYDWNQDQSPVAAALARANFEQAAAMGHKGAVRAFAHLLYEGRGGPKNPEQALLLLWSAFKRGDEDSLEELADLLASYAEQHKDPHSAKSASKISATIENLTHELTVVSDYMHHLLLSSRSQQTDGQ